MESKIKSKDWISPGDTYERYCRRCHLSGIEPREFREWLHFELAIAFRLSPGDTYERYCRRCHLSGIEPREFREWLHFELAIAFRRHQYLDQVQVIPQVQA